MRLKKILLEAPVYDDQGRYKGTTYNKYNNKYNAPSAVSRRPIDVTIENLPDETKQLIDEGKWTEAYRTLTNTDDIKVFIDYFLTQCNLLTSFQSQVEAIHDTLVRAMMSLGDRAFTPETNPLLTFLNQFFGSGSKFDNGEQFKMLVNWWSGGIVTDKNLREQKVQKSIIMNKDIYLKQNNTFIVQAYYWLAKKDNIEAYVKVKDYQLRHIEDKLTQDIHQVILNTKQPRNKATGEFMDKQPYEAIRNYIIFYNESRNPAADPAKTIEEATVIQQRLLRLQAFQTEINDAYNAAVLNGEITPDNNQQTPKKSTSLGIKPVRYDNAEVDAIMSDGKGKLTKDKVNILLNYLKDKGYIN